MRLHCELQLHSSTASTTKLDEYEERRDIILENVDLEETEAKANVKSPTARSSSVAHITACGSAKPVPRQARPRERAASATFALHLHPQTTTLPSSSPPTPLHLHRTRAAHGNDI